MSILIVEGKFESLQEIADNHTDETHNVLILRFSQMDEDEWAEFICGFEHFLEYFE